jgi:predicted dinucleotide-utilizing enzyme
MCEKEIKKVGIIGCGAIGTLVVQSIEKKIVSCDELVLYDHIQKKAQQLKASINFPITIVQN